MKSLFTSTALWIIAAALFFLPAIHAQKAGPKTKVPVKQVIFAVTDGGKRIEPIAAVDGGKLVDTDETADESKPKNFASTYYKPKTAYPIIFGGAADGVVSVTKSNIGIECGGSTADVVSRPVKAKLSGLVMALATPAGKHGTSGYRRRPTPGERKEIETLVRDEFRKQGAPAAALTSLRYHNLTALDVDGDDVPEFVGSYWIAPSDKERRLLFFIAERNAGKPSFAVSDYSLVKPDDVMTGEVKDLDTGVGHELLLDVLDYDADGVKEIFSVGQAFEGNNYHVYKRAGGKWTKVYETYAYRCAY